MSGHHHHHGHDCAGAHHHHDNDKLHQHGHGHHCHGHAHLAADGRLTWAIVINIALTVAQIVAGVFSGSLALIADAIHNLSDAAAIVLALAARKISRRHADEKRTYGYKKVETLAAFTNFLTLIIIAIWLGYEAVTRFFSPETIDGWIVIWVASLAVVIDGATAMLTYKDSKTNQNIRAAYLHNLTDMFASIGVVFGGIMILTMGWTWVDPLITLVISAYILWHAMQDLPSICNILIDGAPEDINTADIVREMKTVDGVTDIHHVHIRHIDETSYALEAHVLASETHAIDIMKTAIKSKLAALNIAHSTLEFEFKPCVDKDCGH